MVRPFRRPGSVLIVLLGLLSCRGGHDATRDLRPLREISLGTFTKTQYPLRYEEALLIADSWKELGLDVRLEPLNFPNPVVERLFLTRDFDTFLVYFTPQLERLEPDFFTYNTFHSSNARPGGWNLAGFTSQEFDELAQAQRREYEVARRRKLVLECQELLYRQNPWLVTINQDELQAYNSKSFRDPVLPKTGGFKDPMAFFTIVPRGGRKVVRWAVEWAGLKTMNPLLVSESTQVRLLHFIYDTLVRLGPNTTPQLWAAETIEQVSELTFEVTLRSGLRFHDGEPLTAEDVAFTFRFMAEQEAVYFRAALEPLASVEVVNTRTVLFHLAHPYTPFITQTLAMTPLLPRHVWIGVDEPVRERNIPPVGSGPFRFEQWKETQELELSRFAEHFAPPNVDGVLVIFFGTREAAFTALTRGDADVVDMLLPHQVEELHGDDDIQTVEIPSHAVDAVVFNLRREPFSDARFRLALAHAVPRQQILDEIFVGYGKVGASVIAAANEAWTHPGLKPYSYDLGKARALLEQAGYEWDSLGRLCYRSGTN